MTQFMKIFTGRRFSHGAEADTYLYVEDLSPEVLESHLKKRVVLSQRSGAEMLMKAVEAEGKHRVSIPIILPRSEKVVDKANIWGGANVRDVIQFEPSVASRIWHRGKPLDFLEIYHFPLTIVDAGLSRPEINKRVIDQWAHLRTARIEGVVQRKFLGTKNFKLIASKVVDATSMKKSSFDKAVKGGD